MSFKLGNNLIKAAKGSTKILTTYVGSTLITGSNINQIIDFANPTIGTLTFGTPGSTYIPISCTASDDVGVTGFDIYINASWDRFVAGTSLSSYNVDGLNSDTAYSIYVVARDAALKSSPNSNTITPTTSSSLSNPIINNFIVENAQPTRVYFDSNVPLTSGTTFGGFTISNKTINSVTIISGFTTGHYFTVSAAFNFWDNNTIRYESGTSNIQDAGANTLYDFTLTYIQNNIIEPTVTGTIYYVQTDGNDINTGLSVGTSTAWATINKAFQTAVGGDKVYIKAGNYGAETIYVAGRDGTASAPIMIEGYKTTAGDLATTLYYNYGDGVLDSAELPLLDGGDRTAGTALQFNNSDYWIVRGLQITNYQNGLTTSGTTGSKYQTFDRILVKEIGNPNTTTASTGIGINVSGGLSTCRILNSTVINCVGTNVRTYSGYNLLNNVKSYSDYDVGINGASDYYISIYEGSNNIVLNSYSERVGNINHTGHTYEVKGNGVISEYNLFANNESVNIKQAVGARHTEVKYNVWKDISIYLLPRSVSAYGTITIRDNATYNIFERIKVSGTDEGIRFYDQAGEQGSQAGGHYNTIRNCIFDSVTQGIVMTSSDGNGLINSNNNFYNNTFYNSDELWNLNSSINDGFDNTNTFTNNIVHTVTNEKAGLGTRQAVYSYSDFYNGFTMPSGTGNITTNPNFIDIIDFVPQATLNGTSISTVKYDYNNIERNITTPKMGAVEAVYNRAILSNFNITDTYKDRVYFDSDIPIKNPSIFGFIIAGKKILKLTINGENTNGHYFTVDSEFTFWDNNTIRFEGKDINRINVHDFTLEYIVNNISEPTASTVRYASRLGNGTTDGLAEGSAWSWAQVQSNAAAGMTIHVKAGGDFSGITISVNGTSTNPIVIKGYKTTIGDLDGIDYYWGGAAYATTNTISNIDAPTLKGAGGATTSNGFSVTGDYVIINNFQSYDWKNNFYFSGNNGLVVDNCYSDATSTSDGSNYYHNLNTSGRVTNSVARNFDLHGMVTYDSPILYDGVDFYLDVVTGGDYFTHISGNNSITRNCTILKAISGANGQHGLTIKGVSGAQYNLIENCIVTNTVDAIELRWDEVQNNVVRGITVNRDGAVLKTSCYGLYIMNGASYNTVENCKFIDIERGVVVIDSDEDLTNTNKGQYNVIKNNIFDRVNHVIRMEAASGASVGNVFQFNDFIFNTVYSGSYLFLGFGAGEQANNNFTNNIVHTIANRVSGTSGFTETYSDYYNGFTMPAGTGNLALNPNFVDLVDFVPQTTLSGLYLSEVHDDYNNQLRSKSAPQMGALELIYPYATLSNFHINDGEEDRVYFNSSIPIKNPDKYGFIISGKEIQLLVINGQSTTGHYFTVDTPFTFWDNNTIRFEGEYINKINVYDFTLTHIENNIIEPVTTHEKYVSVTGGGLHDGSSEANAYTFLEMRSNLTADTKYWVKAGDYGNINVLSGFYLKNYSATTPIIIEGYTNVIGDITTDMVDNFTYTNEASAIAYMNPSVYPVFSGGNTVGTNDKVFYFRESSYFIVRNFQIKNYPYAVNFRDDNGTGEHHIVFENMMVGSCWQEGSGEGKAFGFVANIATTGGLSNNVRIDKCITFNCAVQGIEYGGSHNAVLNSAVYSDDFTTYTGDGQDYWIEGLVSDNCIIRGNYVRRIGNPTHSGHGIGIKARLDSGYTLIDNNHIINCSESLFLAYELCHDSVIKNNIITGDIDNNLRQGTITVRDSAYNNIIENNYLEYVDTFLTMWRQGAEEPQQTSRVVTDGLIVRNNIVKDMGEFVVSVVSNTTDSYTLENVDIVNNTIYGVNIKWQWYNTGEGPITFINNKMRNNNFVNIGGEWLATLSTINDYAQSYNNYYNITASGYSLPSGTGNINENPIFDAVLDDTGFTPTNSALVAGISLTGVEYDYDGAERDGTNPTIGAKEI